MTTTTTTSLKTALGLAAVLALGACANTSGPGYTSSPAASYPSTPYSNAPYTQYGVVQTIELVRLENTGIGGSGVGAGTIVGAVVGGIIGNQVGKGGGNTAATVIGAAGGAYAGHEIEKRNVQTSDAYRISIRMNDGSYQQVTQSSSADIRVGDRVLVANGTAQRY